MKIPQRHKTPLDKNDHPEMDTSEILEGEMVHKYFTMVGKHQWLITLGRLDIHPHVVSLSRFRAAPRQRYIERLKRVYGYVIGTCRILGLTAFNSLLQCVNRLVWEVCSVN